MSRFQRERRDFKILHVLQFEIRTATKKIHLLNEKKCISFFRSYVVVVAVVDCQSTGGSSILLMTANLFSVFPLVVMVATLPLKQRAVVRFHQREPILEYSAAMSERVGVNPTKSGCREVTW